MEDAHHFGLRWICENAITRTKPHCKDRQKIPYIYTHSQSNLMFISFAAVVVASQFYINFLLFFIFFIRNAWMHVALISRLVPLKREEKHYHAFKYRIFASSSSLCFLCIVFRFSGCSGEWGKQKNMKDKTWNQRFWYIFFILRLFVLLQIMNFVWIFFLSSEFYRITLWVGRWDMILNKHDKIAVYFTVKDAG